MALSVGICCAAELVCVVIISCACVQTVYGHCSSSTDYEDELLLPLALAPVAQSGDDHVPNNVVTKSTYWQALEGVELDNKIGMKVMGGCVQ